MDRGVTSATQHMRPVDGEQTVQPVDGEATAWAVDGEQTAWQVDGEETAWQVDGGQTAWQVDGEQTAWQVDGEQTAWQGKTGQQCSPPLATRAGTRTDRPSPSPLFQHSFQSSLILLTAPAPSD
eukprot:355018-Chlamydomonas_euryale.AAC.5